MISFRNRQIFTMISRSNHMTMPFKQQFYFSKQLPSTSFMKELGLRKQFQLLQKQQVKSQKQQVRQMSVLISFGVIICGSIVVVSLIDPWTKFKINLWYLRCQYYLSGRNKQIFFIYVIKLVEYCQSMNKISQKINMKASFLFCIHALKKLQLNKEQFHSNYVKIMSSLQNFLKIPNVHSKQNILKVLEQMLILAIHHKIQNARIIAQNLICHGNIRQQYLSVKYLQKYDNQIQSIRNSREKLRSKLDENKVKLLQYKNKFKNLHLLPSLNFKIKLTNLWESILKTKIKDQK